MTLKYNNVYVKDTATVAGVYEKDGPLKDYFDYFYDELYFNEKTIEQAEMKLQEDSINKLLDKCNLEKGNVSLFIAGDLSNQIAISNFTAKKLQVPYLGMYNACATSVLTMINSSMLVDNYNVNNVLCTTSSHNMTAEKQFRYPNEYGGIKPKRSTFTSTGGASVLLTNEKTNVKITYGTIGVVQDSCCKDAFNMGEVMSIAAANTLYKHLIDTNRKVSDYDLILSGDLGKYGKKILIDYMNKNYNIDISKNYDDCGVLLYDLDKQKEINAGGSGPVCMPLVAYSKIYKDLKNEKYKKVLLIATGAIFSPTTLMQKLTIPSIAHAISWEVV